MRIMRPSTALGGSLRADAKEASQPHNLSAVVLVFGGDAVMLFYAPSLSEEGGGLTPYWRPPTKTLTFPMDVGDFFPPRSDLAFIGGYHGLVDLRVGEIDRIRAQAWGATVYAMTNLVALKSAKAKVLMAKVLF